MCDPIIFSHSPIQSDVELLLPLGNSKRIHLITLLRFLTQVSRIPGIASKEEPPPSVFFFFFFWLLSCSFLLLSLLIPNPSAISQLLLVDLTGLLASRLYTFHAPPPPLSHLVIALSRRHTPTNTGTAWLRPLSLSSSRLLQEIHWPLALLSLNILSLSPSSLLFFFLFPVPRKHARPRRTRCLIISHRLPKPMATAVSMAASRAVSTTAGSTAAGSAIAASSTAGSATAVSTMAVSTTAVS